MSDAVDPVESMPVQIHNLRRELAEVKQQRDRLAEALRELWNNHTLHGAAYELIEQTLSAVKGCTPNNCQRPELCLLTETCIPCAICPHAVEGGKP
jgi:hypothetical protein